MSDPAPPVKDGPLGVDDYAIDRDTAAWLAAAPAEELCKQLDSLDYSWNMHGQEDERARATINAISDRLDELERREGNDGPPGVPHYPDPTEIDDGEFWAPADANRPAPQPGPDYWALRRNDINLCSAQRRDGQPGMFGLGRCTLGLGHNGAHGDLIDRLGGEVLQTRIVQALLLAEGAAPSPSGLPSWQTNDREDAEAIAATVVRALIADGAGSTR